MKNKQSISLTLLSLCMIIQSLIAQVIVQPNGNVKPFPATTKVNKTIEQNPQLLNNVTALKASGKNVIQIASALKSEKVKALDVFKTLKEVSTPDAENIAALCTAGYTLAEIVEALIADQYEINAATRLLKNAESCSFNKAQIIMEVFYGYRLGTMDKVVPIIQTNFTTDAREIVRILKVIHPWPPDIIRALFYSGMADNPSDVCRIIKGIVNHFEGGSHFSVMLTDFKSTPYNRVPFVYIKFADALLVMDATPAQVLETLQYFYFYLKLATHAIEIAKVAKHLGFSREDAATFLRRYTYTATQVLDALQVAYQ